MPGRLDLGNGLDAIEIELHASEGHTTDGMARARPLGVLVVGDYASSVEIPWIHGSMPDYRSTLRRLRPLVEAADVIVPGHGPAHTSEIALRLIDEDEGLTWTRSKRARSSRHCRPGATRMPSARSTGENCEKIGAA